ESVNVELQSRNTSSLLWWMKRMLSTRKKDKVFGGGDMKFVQTENSKVLAFTRTYEDEGVLAVASLSRYPQAAVVDMEHFIGYVPVELISRNHFPAVKEDAPYFFTLDAYSCQTFLLEKDHAEMENDQRLQTIELKKWRDIIEQPAIEALENKILANYIMSLRWFGGKGRGIEQDRNSVVKGKSAIQ